MVEVWLFGRLLMTLSSAFAVVLVIVALTSITYLAMTLSPVVRLPGSDRAARRIGTTIAAAALLLSLMGLRVGAPGGGGEWVPTLAVAVASAAALGAAGSLAAIGSLRAGLLLGAAEAQRRSSLAGERAAAMKRLAEARRAYLEGDDLRAQLAEAEDAVARLMAGLRKLSASGAEIDARLARLDGAHVNEATAEDLRIDLRRAREEVRAKLDLGHRILKAAQAAAFRVAVSAPLTRLFRRRPRQIADAFTGVDPAELPARLGGAAVQLDAFLDRAVEARAELDELALDRPASLAEDDDPLPQAQRDVEAVGGAFRAVRERLDVVRIRLAAQADMDAVAGAAGEVSAKAQASGLPARDLQELLDEVVRAESAIVMATPGELDAHALSETVARGTEALAGHDGASLDEMLHALRELS